MNIDLSEVHELISSLLNETDEMLVDGFFAEKSTEWKTDSTGRKSILTETDKKIEEFLKDEVKNAFPDFGFIGEESAKAEIGEYNWIVDPIDGTNNFAGKFRFSELR